MRVLQTKGCIGPQNWMAGLEAFFALNLRQCGWREGKGKGKKRMCKLNGKEDGWE